MIGTSTDESSGIVSLYNDKLIHFDYPASGIGFIHDGKTIVTYGNGVHLYNTRAKLVSSFDTDDVFFASNPKTNTIVGYKNSNLTVYNSSGRRLLTRKFDADISCLAYNKSGKYMAVSTIDSVTTFLNTETYEVVSQRKDSIPVISIQGTEEETSFYIACIGDSTIIKKISMNSMGDDITLFKTPIYNLKKIKLSYTKGDYLAFTSGSDYILYNISHNKLYPLNVKAIYGADVDALDMSPSGKKVAYAINGKIYIQEIKEDNRECFLPISLYGYNNSIGPLTAALFQNDSIVAMSIIQNDENRTSVLGLFNLYDGTRVGKEFKSDSLVWKMIPLPGTKNVVVPLLEQNCWAVIDFSSASVLRRLSPDTLTACSTLTLTANGKYLLGIYQRLFDFDNIHDSRSLWSVSDCQPVEKIFLCSGPLQDGEHLYEDGILYSYPEKKTIRRMPYLNLSTYGEIFDGKKMANLINRVLSIVDIDLGEERCFDLKAHMQGDCDRYRLVGFKHGFALLFNLNHLMIVDTKNGDVVIEKNSTQYETITSASFFSNRQSVLVSTDRGLYVFDILDYPELLCRWKSKLDIG